MRTTSMDRRSEAFMAGAVICTVAAGVIVVLAAASSTPVYADEREHLEIATNLANGAGYSLDGSATAYRPPTGPLILAAATAVHVRAQYIGMIPALCLVIAALLGAWIVGHRLGMLAGAAVVLYPLNVYTAATLYPRALATAILLALWLVASRSADGIPAAMSRRACVVSGLLTAAFALAVPTMIFSAVVVVLWTRWHQPGRRNRIGSAVFAWSVRNATVIGSPVAFSTGSGLNPLRGNNENATATLGVAAHIGSYVQGAEGVGEVEADDYFRGSAVEWITTHPSGAAVRYGQKVLNYFSPYNRPATAGRGGGLESAGVWASFAVTVALLCVRVLLRRRAPILPSERLFLVLFVANAPIKAVFFARTRFRQPLKNNLIVEAAVAVAVLIPAFTRGRRERVSADGGVEAEAATVPTSAVFESWSDRS
ncbi:hypothetical protein [Rhodococcus aetherivorans]|uniref:hypothetical protein n=1 Tax=Rhodococcus aetherivorans TaxID=191292 RepID=UPI0012DD3BE3|nr:hypothetical protein [Rhodococcus aetherivorans]